MSSLSFVIPTLFGLEGPVGEELRRLGLQEVKGENGPLYQIQFSLLKDQVSLMLDTSGLPLHKRGYRQDKGLAPLRETLAAALVLFSRCHGKGPLFDPHCGSGTIPIEAALIARNIAPGLQRHFSAEQWPWLKDSLWQAARTEAKDKEFHGEYDIWGGDVDPHCLRIAKQNARRAGVADLVRFSQADSANFSQESDFGTIVTNPPYGERLLEQEEAKQLYAAFGKAVSRLSPAWRISVLTPFSAFEEAFGRTAEKKRKLYNGKLKCQLYLFGKIPGRN